MLTQYPSKKKEKHRRRHNDFMLRLKHNIRTKNPTLGQQVNKQLPISLVQSPSLCTKQNKNKRILLSYKSKHEDDDSKQNTLHQLKYFIWLRSRSNCRKPGDFCKSLEVGCLFLRFLVVFRYHCFYVAFTVVSKSYEYIKTYHVTGIVYFGPR